MIFVNGKEIPLPDGLTVEQYLTEKNYQFNRIAVELNGDILPKSQYAQTLLHSGDKLEVVSFVGGG